ncbi:hypothetical protein [Streptomyces sp. NPDC002779]|uniref:hypothetical protein n=1 Tax=Streptomyces sp. NPDC002779 TaxID=3364664 RepID=UPI0036B764FC
MLETLKNVTEGDDGLVVEGLPRLLGRIGLGPGWDAFGDDLPGGGQVCASCFGLGQSGGQVVDLAA